MCTCGNAQEVLHGKVGEGGEVIRDRRFSYVGLPLSVRYVCSEMNAEGFL